MINLRNLVDLGFFSINLYGVLFALSLLGVFLVFRNFMLKNGKHPDLALSGTLWIFIGMLIGARLFHVLFYNLSYFLDNPIELFYLWNGGMSFHGGLIGV